MNAKEEVSPLFDHKKVSVSSRPTRLLMLPPRIRLFIQGFGKGPSFFHDSPYLRRDPSFKHNFSASRQPAKDMERAGIDIT